MSQQVARAGTIFEAAAKGDLAAVERMVSANPGLVYSKEGPQDPDPSWSWGSTPLHLAARSGHIEVVRFLLAHDAQIDAKRNDRETPLAEAAANGHVAIVRLLLDRSANINNRGINGNTPLYWAAHFGQIEVARLLISAGAAIDFKGDFGETPLQNAVENGHVDIVQLLLARGANVNSKAENGATPLHSAAWFGQTEIASVLIAHGADVNNHQLDGGTPLHNAAFKGYIAIVRMLLQHGAGFDVTDKNGNEPIHVAATNHQSGVIALLIASGQDIDARNAAGETPLAVAARTGQVNVMQFLIGAGADIAARNRAGQTPLDEAMQAGQVQAADLLRQYQNVLNERAARDAALRASGIVIRPGYLNWIAPNAQAKPVYTNTFRTGKIGTEWTTTAVSSAQQAPLRVSTTPIGNRPFLGDFGNQTVRLTLSNLPPHKEVSISFDLYLLRAWQGNDMYAGPHLWSLNVVDGPTLLHTTFVNYLEVVSPDIKMQAYPGEYAGDHYALQTGAAETNTLGYSYNKLGQTVNMDSVYQLSYTFPHTGSMLLLDFTATGLQVLPLTSWGITNVQVSVAAPRSAPARRIAVVRSVPARTMERSVPRTVIRRSAVQRPRTATRIAATKHGVKSASAQHPSVSAKRLHPIEKPPTP